MVFFTVDLLLLPPLRGIWMNFHASLSWDEKVLPIPTLVAEINDHSGSNNSEWSMRAWSWTSRSGCWWAYGYLKHALYSSVHAYSQIDEELLGPINEAASWYDPDLLIRIYFGDLASLYSLSFSLSCSDMYVCIREANIDLCIRTYKDGRLIHTYV